MSEFIYIVDDDEIVRDLLRKAMLQHQNRHVQCFTSGDAFLADRHDRERGVLLLDIQMPGSSGLDVLKKLSKETKRFETIVLTASGKIAVAVEAMKHGACGEIPTVRGMRWPSPMQTGRRRNRCPRASRRLMKGRASNR